MSVYAQFEFSKIEKVEAWRVSADSYTLKLDNLRFDFDREMAGDIVDRLGKAIVGFWPLDRIDELEHEIENLKEVIDARNEHISELLNERYEGHELD